MAQDVAGAIAANVTDVTLIERRWQVKPVLLLLPSVLVTILFLFYPLAFIILMSFTQQDSFLSLAGPTYTWQNYADMIGRYAPNVGVTIQLAGLATLVDLIFGFPFAYILVRKVRYRDVVRGFMVFPMFGALYIAFGMRFILGTLNEQRTLAWTLYQCGVVQLDYGLATTMGVVLMILAFTVNYASLRYSRGGLV